MGNYKKYVGRLSPKQPKIFDGQRYENGCDQKRICDAWEEVIDFGCKQQWLTRVMVVATRT